MQPEDIRAIGEERTPEDGVIRLMRWPEGYVSGSEVLEVDAGGGLRRRAIPL